ncbi:MAG: hypothetical protein AB3N64_08495 [Puniceicoccaceae bacterium]
MSSSQAFTHSLQQKRSRRRCRHIDKFRKQLEERGILLEEVISSDDCYCTDQTSAPTSNPSGESDSDCANEYPERWKSDHKELISTLEKGFDKVGVNLTTLAQQNESLKLSLAEQVGAIGREVAPEYFQWILTILATGSQRAAAEALGIKRSTFSDRLKRYAGNGGIYSFLFSLVKLRSRVLGSRKLEHYNEEYLAHQNPGDGYNDEELLHDLLDALESQNERNWPKVRQELVDLLKEHIG